MADYKTPQWLLPNEKNLAYPAAGDGVTGSGLSEDRHSLYSMDFPGSAAINYSTPVDLGVVSTFSFWMNIDVGTTGALFGNTALGTFEYVVYYSGSGFFFKIAGAYADFPNAAAAISTGQWHHVAFVRPSQNEVKCYIDSVLTDTITSWTGTPGSNPIKFDLIGSRPGGGLSYSGKIDEICGFKRALSDLEVAALSVNNAPANVMALPDKPYAYYPLGEQAQMGSANWSFPNGSLQSHAIDFDGSTDYISAGSLSYITSNVFTISGWIKATTSPPTYMPLFNFQNSSGVGSKFNWNHGAAPILWYSGSTSKYFVGGSWRTDGLWHNVTLVIDRTTIGNSKLYVDGDEISGGVTSGSGAMVLNDLHLGYNPTTQFYEGEMSNVAIWNSDQTTNKDNIYNNGSPQSTYTTTPNNWWKLNAANSSYDTATSTWTFINTETPAPNYTSALDFDGALIDGININNDSSLEPSTSFTLSCWIKSETSQNFYAYPVYKESLDSSHVAYGFYLQGSSTIATTVTTNGVITSDNIGDLRDGKWHHVVQTYDGSGMKVYLDGVQSGTTKSITGNVVYSATSPELYIGNTRRTSPSGYFSFKGNISNVALFNTAIDAAGVSTLFNSGTPQTSISYSPTSWWKLDNITTGIQDSVGSNNGTITGSVTQVATNVLISNDGESDTLPTSALTPSDLQFESPYSNYSLSFDGTSNFMGTTESILPSAGDMTVSAWVKFNDTTSLQGIFESANYYTTGFNGGFGLRANGVGLSAAFSNGTSFVYNIEPAGFTIGDWFHVAFTFNNTSKLGTYYVNGLSIGTHTFNSAYDNADLVNGAELGRVVKNSGYILNGNLDEVSVFSSVLTQAQITQIYNNSYPADLTSLSPASWWRLGEDAYFVSNTVTIPNKVVGGATMTGNGTQTAILVGNAPGSYANGSGTNLVVTDRIGDAAESTANSVSINMIPSNRHSYTAGYVPTQVNNAFSMAFDGVDDYISAPNTFLNSATVCSISFWGKKDASNKSLCSGGFIDNSNGIWINWHLDGNIYFSPRGLGAASYFLSYAQSYDSNWHHYTGVYDGTSAANCKLYLDGNLVATGTGTPPASLPATTGDVFQIGALGTSFYTTGSTDEVAIFDYALSERQIKQDIYNGTTTGKTADLNNISNLTAPVAWYRMGD